MTEDQPSENLQLNDLDKTAMTVVNLAATSDRYLIRATKQVGNSRQKSRPIDLRPGNLMVTGFKTDKGTLFLGQEHPESRGSDIKFVHFPLTGEPSANIGRVWFSSSNLKEIRTFSVEPTNNIRWQEIEDNLLADYAAVVEISGDLDDPSNLKLRTIKRIDDKIYIIKPEEVDNYQPKDSDLLSDGRKISIHPAIVRIKDVRRDTGGPEKLIERSGDLMDRALADVWSHDDPRVAKDIQLERAIRKAQIKKYGQRVG